MTQSFSYSVSQWIPVTTECKTISPSWYLTSITWRWTCQTWRSHSPPYRTLAPGQFLPFETLLPPPKSNLRSTSENLICPSILVANATLFVKLCPFLSIINFLSWWFLCFHSCSSFVPNLMGHMVYSDMYALITLTSLLPLSLVKRAPWKQNMGLIYLCKSFCKKMVSFLKIFVLVIFLK